MAELSNELGARGGAVSLKKSLLLAEQSTYLAATIAWMHVLSSTTPTWVVSSRETVGMLNALGRRARQLDLFWSSKV